MKIFSLPKLATQSPRKAMTLHPTSRDDARDVLRAS